MGRTGGELLTAQLRAEGVEVVFGLPGIHLMRVLDAIHGEPGLDFMTTRHEQATTYMADGYARTTGRPGVALVVPGPGVYNAASGLATAWACSSPVLLLAGHVTAFAAAETSLAPAIAGRASLTARSRQTGRMRSMQSRSATGSPASANSTAPSTTPTSVLCSSKMPMPRRPRSKRS
jgi:hypothetical protein